MDDQRDLAVKRLKAKRAFKASLLAYVVINAFMVGVWAISGAGYFWPIWVMLGWGVGLAIQAWHTFGERPINEDAIQREMDKGDTAV